MHKKTVLIKGNEGRKCMDVVLKEEIPVSKGQVSAQQGQELGKHFMSGRHHLDLQQFE